MSQMHWWRCMHGAPFNPKWRVVALVAKSEPGKVWAVVSALYDRASQAKERGDVAGAGLDDIAEGFGWSLEEVQRIYSALKVKAVIIDNRIASWEKHQPKRERPKDSSTERTRRYRERLKMASQGVTGDGVTVTEPVTVRDGPVTVVTDVTDETPSQAPGKPQLYAINGGACDATVTPRDARERLEESLLSSSSYSQSLVDTLLVCEERKPRPRTTPRPISSKIDRGSRWTLDAVPEAWITEVTAAHPTVDVRAEALSFVNYWISVPGSKGLKLNWKATWTGWIQREAKRLKERSNGKANSGQSGHRGKILDDHPLGNSGAMLARLAAQREDWERFDA